MKRAPRRGFLLSLLILCIGSCTSNHPNLNATIAAQNTKIAQIASATRIPNTQQAGSDVNTRVQPTRETKPDVSTNVPATVISVTTDACESAKWEVIPIGVYEYSYGGGWKNIIVPLVLHNGSPNWGIIGWAFQNMKLVTEGGFEYGPLREGYNEIKVPASLQDSPYAGYEKVPNRMSSYISVPPGFYVRGTYDECSYPCNKPSLSGSPSEWFQVVFRVPETQNHYSLNFPAFSVWCTLPDGTHSDGIYPASTIDLDRDIRSVEFPTNRPKSDFKLLIGSEIPKKNVSILVTDITVVPSSDIFSLNMILQVTNKNLGDNVEGALTGYIIDGAGLIRVAESGYFYIGPGLQKVVEASFLGRKDYQHMYFVDMENRQVYNITDIP